MPYTDPMDPDQFMAQRQQQAQPAPMDPDEFMARRVANLSPDQAMELQRARAALAANGTPRELAEQDKRNSAQQDSPLWRLIGGAWDAAKQVPAAIGTAMDVATHPTRAAEFGMNLIQSHVDQAQKAKDAWKRGDKVEAVGHGLAAAAPAVGPAAAHAGERIGGELKYDTQGHAVGVERDPDVYGGAGEGAALVAMSSPTLMRGAAKASGAVTRGAATVLDRAGVPEALERSAGVNYRKMLTPTSDDALIKAERIAGGPSASGPTGLVKERPVALTRAGMMKKARAGMRESGPAASTVYDDKPALDPTPILDHLEALRGQKAVVKGTGVVSDPALNGAIDELRGNLEDMRGADGKVPARSLDDFVDKLNRGLVSPKGNMRSLSPQTASAIEKSLAGRTRAYLDAAYPDAARVNDAYSTAKGTNDLLEQQRKNEIKAESGVRTGTASGFGAALKKMVPAPLRGIPNAISALTDSVVWDSVSGATKAKVAELIRNGSLDQAAKMMRPLPKLLGQGDIVTPEPPDLSNVKTTPLAPHQEVNRMRKALPQGKAQFTQGTSVPDISGRPDLRRPYNAGLLPPPEAGQPPMNVLPRGPGSVEGRPYMPSSAGRPRPLPRVIDTNAEDFGQLPDDLPHYAKGGIIRRKTLLVDAETKQPTGVMAEKGPEAIVPLGETAAAPTVPEKSDTIGEQLGQLVEHKRRVVMIPRGTFPHEAPQGMVTHQDQHGNRYVFNPSLISKNDIKVAIAMNRLPLILGAARGGMGAPDKSKLRGPMFNVAGRSRKGVTLQSTAADKPHLGSAIRQTKLVTPKGGKVSIEPPSKEIARRLA